MSNFSGLQSSTHIVGQESNKSQSIRANHGAARAVQSESSDTMRFVKRRIQDTGATEEHDDGSKESLSNAPLTIIDDQAHRSNQSKVLEELLAKQKRLRSKIGQLNTKQLEEEAKASRPQSEKEEDESFNAYRLDDAPETQIRKKSLNNSRNLAGISNINRSLPIKTGHMTLD
jgi:hypothetical protein